MTKLEIPPKKIPPKFWLTNQRCNSVLYFKKEKACIDDSYDKQSTYPTKEEKGIMTSNNAILFKKPPTEFPVDGEHLAFEERAYDLPEPAEGEFVVENLYVSIDPYQRGRMRSPEKKSYSPPYALGRPMTNHGVGRVFKSNNSAFSVGDVVFGQAMEWAEYTLVDRATATRPGGIMKVDNKHGIPLSNFVGAVGMPGMTAFSSFYEIGKPKKGETIFISAASGAVGQIVGQLAKREGLTVVGSAGTDAKVDFLRREMNFDAAFNYKTESPATALATYCPDGIDIYFENVGGETLEAVLTAMNTHGRIICCGMISQYNTTTPYGVTGLMAIIGKRLTLRGFIVGDFWAQYAKEFYEMVPKWLASGEIKYRETITEGLERGPSGFIDMLNGRNFGKALIKIK